MYSVHACLLCFKPLPWFQFCPLAKTSWCPWTPSWRLLPHHQHHGCGSEANSTMGSDLVGFSRNPWHNYHIPFKWHEAKRWLIASSYCLTYRSLKLFFFFLMPPLAWVILVLGTQYVFNEFRLNWPELLNVCVYVLPNRACEENHSLIFAGKIQNSFWLVSLYHFPRNHFNL